MLTLATLVLLTAAPPELTGDEPAVAGHRSAERTTVELRREYGELELLFADDVASPVRASIYSLPSRFFAPEEVARLLRALRARVPQRTLIALLDPPFARSLAPLARELEVHVVATGAWDFTPWPRDPFLVAHAREGGAVLVARPNLQPGREADAGMAEVLARGLAREVGSAWGGTAWTRSPVPFHAGQLLLSPERAWISLHTLEMRILELLGEERVPVESFRTAAGIDRYLAAAREAAGELEELLGRPVAFAHPLPEAGTVAERARRMHELGGGAGYDLDSWLTLVADGEDGLGALVADVGAGLRLLERLEARDWEALREGYDLWASGPELRRAVRGALAEDRGQALGRFLDVAAEHLADQGLEVRRLPLLRIPVELVRGVKDLRHDHFVISWNNVVVERRGGRAVAEGFASLLEPGDMEAREVFAAAGVELELLPPLVASVILNGGYRCASNHLRQPAAPAPASR